MDPTVVILAIEAAVKLGRKTYEVLVDETAQRSLLLPVGDLFGSVPENVATQFFLQQGNLHLSQAGGPYENFTPAEQLKAHRTLLEINRRLDNPAENLQEAQQVVIRLHAFQQLQAGFGPTSPVQRLLGTVVEIGIDYFASHPEAMGRDSSARRVIQAFLSGLTDADFAEASLAEIGGDLLSAALGAFEHRSFCFRLQPLRHSKQLLLGLQDVLQHRPFSVLLARQPSEKSVLRLSGVFDVC